MNVDEQAPAAPSDAGESLLLSPDGRYIAGRADLEGVHYGESAADWQSATGVMDVVTGDVVTYHEGTPIAWSPDGRLLTRLPSGQLRLLDVNSGDAVTLAVADAEAFAFSPDGRQLAMQVGSQVQVLDVTTHAVGPIVDLAPTQRLAAPGAWTADGRLAVWDRTECSPVCPTGHEDLRLSFVDISGGPAQPAGLDVVRAPVPARW